MVYDTSLQYRTRFSTSSHEMSLLELSSSSSEAKEADEAQPPEWIPVELEMVSMLWLPDSEILRLKGFHRLSVLDRLQVRDRDGQTQRRST